MTDNKRNVSAIGKIIKETCRYVQAVCFDLFVCLLLVYGRFLVFLAAKLQAEKAQALALSEVCISLSGKYM